MKTYEVEYRRISHIMVTVEADNEEQAEQKAWEKLETYSSDIEDADWYVESIEGMKEKETK